jgi:choline dehydrogenase-like flavoprotein
MRTDVLIIGGGIMGAVVAASIRADRPDVDLVIVDTGPRIGDVVGLHLHDVEDEDIWRAYNQLAGSGSQAVYVGAQLEQTLGGAPSTARPGMYDLTAFGGEAPGLPGAAIAWNAGGMGVHWTAATPTPYGSEVPDTVPADEWRRDLERAQRLLGVEPDPYGPTPARGPVLSVLDDAFGDVSAPGRGPQPMPMALRDGPDGRMVRTGPSTIFPPLAHGGDERTRVLTETTCLRIEHVDGRATGAVLRGLRDDVESTVTADAVVVAADVLRSPQLLWASGIRPAALGTHLNEHAMLTGRALLDHERFDLDLATIPPLRDREWNSGSSWLPMSGPEQPFQAQLMETAAHDAAGTVTGYHVGLTWYVPTAVRPENRIEFSEDDLDPVGLPAMRIRFALTDDDRAAIERARVDQARVGHALGVFDQERDTAVLPAGSSLHMTGSVRMGAVDDGTSVCDTDGLVWGTKNVLVAGNGVLPTALAANSTLAGSVTAVRAARRAALVVEGARA